MAEQIRSEVNWNNRIDFAEGISKQYGIEENDSLRVRLNEVLDEWGNQVATEVDEVFVADLLNRSATELELPSELCNLHDIEEGNYVKVDLLELIKADETVSIAGDTTEFSEKGETLLLQVGSHKQRVEYAEGISKKHGIGQGDSLRVELLKVVDQWGSTQSDDIGETFIVDLLNNSATRFEIPGPICDAYDIEEDMFVRVELLEVIGPDETQIITDPTRARSETDEELPMDVEGVDDVGKSPDKAQFRHQQLSRELLEDIVADVLQSLGFDVETNEYVEGKGEEQVEVDVWANRDIAGSKFFVYTSCKNWQSSVNKDVIDQEVGRTSMMLQSPHLRILVVKRLSQGARNAAAAMGFLTVELGEQATSGNAEEIYEEVYHRLAGAFVSIAPPELRSLAGEAEERAEELAEIADNIEEFADRIKRFSS